MKRVVSVALLGVLLVCRLAAPAAAQDEVRMKLATRLLELLEARKMIERQTDAVMKSQLEAIAAVGQGAGMPPGEIKKIEALQGEVRDLIMKEIGWDTIVKDGIPIYASLFTEEELRAMITFFETPAGRAWIQKSPEVTSRMVQIMQTRMTTIMPKVMELIKKRLQLPQMPQLPQLPQVPHLPQVP